MELVVADIGGTHARFAIARLEAQRTTLYCETVFKAAQFASLQTAWEAFGATIDRPRPRNASIAVACPTHDDVLKFTNSPWVLRASALKQQLDLDRLTLINDFAAVGHAVANIDEMHLRTICGPNKPLREQRTISVIGPGTGLGVAQVVRRPQNYDVISTEGGHTSFAPFDRLEDLILSHLRQRFPRVSAERIISGPGLANIYAALAAIEGRSVLIGEDKVLWETALAGEDSLASAALERFCMCFGAYAGDIALAQGAQAVVIAGGLALRLADNLQSPGFSHRFTAKGRFETLMADIPVKLMTHTQPGLLGAATAFVHEYGT